MAIKRKLKNKKVKNKKSILKKKLIVSKKTKKVSNYENKIKRQVHTKTKKSKTKKLSQIILKNQLLEKPKINPIISPNLENNWESWQTFNPGAILLHDKIHFIYRAIGNDGISRLGYASSVDGFNIDERLNYPVYEHKTKNGDQKYFIYSVFSGGSFGGAEDPRLVRVNNEDKIYMTYTACDNGLRVGFTLIKVNDFLNKKWRWQEPKLISKPGEVHKNWVIFPEKINGKYAILHTLIPTPQIAYLDDLEFKNNEYIESYYDPNFRNKNSWDFWIRGAGAPPIKTKLGWLLFYHCMEKNNFSCYKVGAMILDEKDPSKILLKSQCPVIEPKEEYELNGFKGGVVYVTGTVIKDENILIYYGAADSYISVAYTNLDKFLDNLVAQKPTPTPFKKVKIKK